MKNFIFIVSAAFLLAGCQSLGPSGGGVTHRTMGYGQGYGHNYGGGMGHGLGQGYGFTHGGRGSFH